MIYIRISIECSHALVTAIRRFHSMKVVLLALTLPSRQDVWNEISQLTQGHQTEQTTKNYSVNDISQTVNFSHVMEYLLTGKPCNLNRSIQNFYHQILVTLIPWCGGVDINSMSIISICVVLLLGQQGYNGYTNVKLNVIDVIFIEAQDMLASVSRNVQPNPDSMWPITPYYSQ